ncbi:E3 ubiquitin-protein ligase TRIM63-like [Hoplias malabaricus]|uniref:E3 ubiquitin-protein ligase TRIM63-like n=1 Tax=Hoplias malabaricus TaxID=27720 RepID=UPI00346226E8
MRITNERFDGKTQHWSRFEGNRLRITDIAKACTTEWTEVAYESMVHFTIHTEGVATMLRAIDFTTGEDGEDDYDLDEGPDNQACLPGTVLEPRKD